ncbi:MAG TPA: uracil-DNA glycosylase [Fimbriimonadaceae bacterium]|nr:uracil-DNA glycosylase [Fimbriimonadaceae bacterium]
MDRLNEEIVSCHACPRLVAWREQVAKDKKKQFADWDYWGRPVPNFGDPDADRLIVGLAPAAHGANRTGRMFTGDRSGDWLYRALHKARAASQPNSDSAADGLTLTGILITATVHCAPPDNKPLPSEVEHCRGFFRRTLALREWKAILCLGSIAWNQTLRALGEKSRPFGHGHVEQLACGIKLVASYHPSQQNTFTGKLTESMLDAAIAEFLG